VNKVAAPDAAQALLDMLPFLGLIPEEILPLGLFLLRSLGAFHRFQRVRVVAGVPRLGRDGHGRGSEVLHLLKLEVEALGEHRQFGHIGLGTARVAGDEVGDELLAQTLLAADAVEAALEVVELRERRLAHEL